MMGTFFVFAIVMFAAYLALKILFAICKGIYDIPRKWRESNAEEAEKKRRAALTPAQRLAEDRAKANERREQEWREQLLYAEHRTIMGYRTLHDEY